MAVMKTLVNPGSSGSNTLFVRHLACLFLLLGSTGAYAAGDISVSTSALQVVFKWSSSSVTTNGSLQVTVSGNTWKQKLPTSAWTVTTAAAVGPTELTATVQDPDSMMSYSIDLKLDTSLPPKPLFQLTLTPPDENPSWRYNYAHLPPYPFIFKGFNATDTWYYVQNNGGEGTLWNMGDQGDMDEVRGLGGWAGGQPWWGVTNLTQAMMARLDSFVQVENPGANGDQSAYEIPLQIEYSFYNTDGYVGLAKAYRDHLLGPVSTLETLQQRVDNGNTDLSFLKDGTYAYVWADADDNYDTFTDLVDGMKAAGLDRVVAMFSLHEDPTRLTQQMLDYIADNGSRWLGGLYRTPTPNLFQICSIDDWVNKLLLNEYDMSLGHKVTEGDVLANDDPDMWGELDTAYSEPAWNTGATGLPYLASTYHDNLRVIYHDTLPQQLGPSIDRPTYNETIEENLAGRQKILDDTRSYTDMFFHPSHFLAGSGEGVSAFWTIAHLDYWEGGMEESIYGDIDRHPNTEFQYEFADNDFTPPPIDDEMRHNWYSQELDCLDDQHRIPLLALQWHNYVAETWNWRDSTFVVSSLSWKKDLFNILYCGMPMWHVSPTLWGDHSEEYKASYFKLLPVRQANGFAEMTDHQFVGDPQVGGVQYTDWDNENRVIVNFGEGDYTYDNSDLKDPDYGSIIIPPHGYAMLPDLVSQDCEGSTNPSGWTYSSSGAHNWNYLFGGNEWLYLTTTGTSGSSTMIDFGDHPEVWVYFKLRLTTTSQGTKTIGGLAQNGGSTVSQLFQVSTIAALPSFGGVGGTQFTSGFAANTTYNVWLHYRRAFGVNNGVVDLAWSTGNTKPTDSGHFAQSTTYAGTNDAGRLVLGTYPVHTAFDMIVDDIRVAYGEIGNVP